MDIDEMERRIRDVSSEDPIKTLKRDKAIISKIKRENVELKLKVDRLLQNNKKLVKLVKALERKMRKLIDDSKKTYIYSYENGGWIEKGSLNKRKMEIRRNVDIEDINLQLSEILRLLKEHGEKI